jgi:hypothetical protein
MKLDIREITRLIRAESDPIELQRKLTAIIEAACPVGSEELSGDEMYRAILKRNASFDLSGLAENGKLLPGFAGDGSCQPSPAPSAQGTER